LLARSSGSSKPTPRPNGRSTRLLDSHRSILAIGLGVKAAHAGYSVLFDTANNWITRLADAHQAGRLETELKKIRRYKLIIIDLCRHRDYAEDSDVRASVA
jgi:IstB-like ATP binding protein